MIRTLAKSAPITKIAWRIAQWHLRYLLFNEARPVSCGYYITSKCNLHCSFCNIRSFNPHFQSSEEELRAALEDLGKLGVIYFSISGGEPLLIPHLFDSLAYAKECGILFTHLVSNGALMDAEKAQRLHQARLSEISFSIDGPEEMHNALRGAENAYQQVLNAIDLIQKHAPQTQIVINTILDPLEVDRTRKVVEITKALGLQMKVQPINTHPFFNEGCANKARTQSLKLSPHQEARLRETIHLLQSEQHVINSRPFLKNYLRYLLEPEKNCFHKAKCIYGYHHLEYWNQQFFPCLEGLDWKNGFPRTESQRLPQLLRSKEYRKIIQGLQHCTGCDHNYYVCYYEPRLNFPLWNFLRARRPW